MALDTPLVDAEADRARALLATAKAGVAPRWIAAIGADGRAFPIEKLAAHEHGQLHAAVSVFLFDGPHLLLQRRAAGKYHCPGLWANSCCSHPDWGETAAAAAVRRVAEELGVNVSLTHTAEIEYRAEVTAGLIEHERVQVFRGDLDGASTRFAPDPIEVDGLAWVRPTDVIKDAARRPDRYAPWFRIYLQRWGALNLDHRQPEAARITP